VLVAIAAYVRPAGVFWAVVPFLLLLRRVPFRRAVALGAVALIAFSICMTPWWVRNERIYDRFVPFTAGSGDALLQGSYTMFNGTDDEYEAMRETVLVWRSDKLRNLTAEEELQADSHYRELALERLKDQFLHHPGKLLWGRIRVTTYSFVTPSFTPEYAGFAQRAVQLAQFLLLLVPAAAIVWIRRADRRILLLGSLPTVIGLTYAAILIQQRYVFPLMPVVVLLAAAGWLHLFDWVSSRRAARNAGRQQSLPGPGSAGPGS
jgi:uncharacterized membrane protein YfcA